MYVCMNQCIVLVIIKMTMTVIANETILKIIILLNDRFRNTKEAIVFNIRQRQVKY